MSPAGWSESGYLASTGRELWVCDCCGFLVSHPYAGHDCIARARTSPAPVSDVERERAHEIGGSDARCVFCDHHLHRNRVGRACTRCQHAVMISHDVWCDVRLPKEIDT